MPPKGLFRTASAMLAIAALSCSGGRPVAGTSATTSAPAATTAPAAPAAQPATDTPPPPSSAPTGVAFSPPPDLAADCSTDVAGRLTAWIASVPDNSVLSFPKGACYRVDTPLTIQQRSGLLLDGNGATLKAVAEGDRNRDHLRIMGSSNITVRNLVVRGANPHAGAAADAYRANREAQHGFDLLGVEGVLLDGVEAYDLFGDFVYIGGAKVASAHVTVRNSHFERGGRQGISVTNGEDVVIEGNLIAGVPRSLFDLEPNSRTGRALHVQLIGNQTGPAHNFWLASKGVGSDVGDITIRGNVMQAATGGLIWVRTPATLPARSEFTVDDNTFLAQNRVSDEGSTGAFFFQNCADVTITGNRVTFEPDQHTPAVELRATTRVTINGNRFDGATSALLADAASTEVHEG